MNCIIYVLSTQMVTIDVLVCFIPGEEAWILSAAHLGDTVHFAASKRKRKVKI